MVPPLAQSISASPFQTSDCTSGAGIVATTWIYTFCPILECRMHIELWPLARLKPYDRNPRLNDDAVESVARSIREFGFRQPIVVDENDVIIVGHTRYK